MEYPHYQPQSDLLPLSDDELGQLDELLAALPSDAAMNIEALDGYLTALLLSPRPLAQVPGAEWMPEIWGGDGSDGNAPFSSGKQKKRVMMMVLRHLRTLDDLLRNKPDKWEPIFSVAEGEEADLVDAEDWCIGFMLAVDLAADDWAVRFEDETQGALLSPIALLGGDESQQDPQDLAQLANAQLKDALSREIPDAVLALAGHG